jgi:hypothetical protein
MAYCTIAQVTEYLGITGTGDDDIIDALITRAGAWIDTYTGRTFEASADTTRSFTVDDDTEGRWLHFDADLASITTVTTNADATTPTTVSSTEYVTHPRNDTPYYAIQILSSVDKEWTYTTNPENGVTVAGRWAYSTSAPNLIVHACVRLTAYLYRQRDAQVFETTALPDAGVITTPTGMPREVKIMLEPYKRKAAY